MCCDNLAFLKALEGRTDATDQRHRVELLATRRVARRTVTAFRVGQARKIWSVVMKRQAPEAGNPLVSRRANVRPKKKDFNLLWTAWL